LPLPGGFHQAPPRPLPRTAVPLPPGSAPTINRLTPTRRPGGSTPPTSRTRTRLPRYSSLTVRPSMWQCKIAGGLEIGN